MIIKDFKTCPICSSGLYNPRLGYSTSLTRECGACDRYTYFENLLPTQESITQMFWDSAKKYNIIIFDYGTQRIFFRLGYTDQQQHEIFPKSYEEIMDKLDILATFS